MKNYFVINPAAGKGKEQIALEKEIERVCRERGVDFVIYHTTCTKDAEEFVRRTANAGGEEKRFYLCGGDGTFNEGVNGAVGAIGAACGVIPVGTGNDFTRNFTNRDNFWNIEAQLDGSTMKCDLIKYGDRYCVNALNAGFDCIAAKYASELKRKVPGKLAYVAGVAKSLIRMPGVQPKVTVNGELIINKDAILICVANGSFYGGGFKSAPFSALDDGKMQLNAISMVTRLEFIKIVSSYKNGTFVNEKNRGILDYSVCRSAFVDFGCETAVSVDGEIEYHTSLELSVAHGAFDFIVPAGCKQAVNPEAPAMVRDLSAEATSV
jgi:YegS/Rv2252/BmrU family lipid kinase